MYYKSALYVGSFSKRVLLRLPYQRFPFKVMVRFVTRRDGSATQDRVAYQYIDIKCTLCVCLQCFRYDIRLHSNTDETGVTMLHLALNSISSSSVA